MTPTQIVIAVVAALFLLVGGWGVWEWGQVKSIQQEFDTYRLTQARLVAKQQEAILAEVQRNDANSANARNDLAGQKRAIDAKYGPIVAQYHAFAQRLRDHGIDPYPMPADSKDSAGVDGSSAPGGNGSLDGYPERFATVVESAGRVAASLKACTESVARYRAAIGWEIRREGSPP